MSLSGWLVLWVDHPVSQSVGTAIGAFPLQEIAGNFYGAGAAGARLHHRDPEQPCTGRFTGTKPVPAPG